MHLVAATALRRLDAVPVGYRDDTLLVAMANPTNVLALDDLAMLTDLRVEPVVVSREDLDVLLQRVNSLEADVDETLELDSAPDDAAPDALETSADDAPTVKLVRSIIAHAIEAGAGRRRPCRPRTRRGGAAPLARRDPRDGADGVGQVDLAVRLGRRRQHAGEDAHDDRGSGRVPPARRQADAGLRARRAQLRDRSAGDRARRPDIIMVGEMRDRESAKIAIEAALTATSCSLPCTRTARRQPGDRTTRATRPTARRRHRRARFLRPRDRRGGRPRGTRLGGPRIPSSTALGRRLTAPNDRGDGPRR